MRYLNAIEDERGDLVDIEVYCSAECWREAGLGDPYGHYIPCPEMADYRQYCPVCETCTVAAIGEDGFDSWPENPDLDPDEIDPPDAAEQAERADALGIRRIF
jgi:hypothetical protein